MEEIFQTNHSQNNNIISNIIILLGSSILTPKETYIINFPKELFNNFITDKVINDLVKENIRTIMKDASTILDEYISINFKFFFLLIF